MGPCGLGREVEETASSVDGGKTWTLHGWATGPTGNDSAVMTMNGKPFLRVAW